VSLCDDNATIEVTDVDSIGLGKVSMSGDDATAPEIVDEASPVGDDDRAFLHQIIAEQHCGLDHLCSTVDNEMSHVFQKGGKKINVTHMR